jgi:hypothetical protein
MFGASAPNIAADADAAKPTDSMLAARLATARRALAEAVAEYARIPGSSRLSERVDEAAREVAQLECQIVVHRAQAKHAKPLPVAKRNAQLLPATSVEERRGSQVVKALERMRLGAKPEPVHAAADFAVAADRAVAAARAAPAASTHSAAPTKNCPQCIAPVASDADRCECCGFVLMPAKRSEDEFISREELLALRQGITIP